MTVFDEDWTEDDMHAHLEWQAEQANRCPGCGNPYDESTDPSREEAYEADLVTCFACKPADSLERAHREDGGSMDGVRRRIREVGSGD